MWPLALGCALRSGADAEEGSLLLQPLCPVKGRRPRLPCTAALAVTAASSGGGRVS